MSNPNASSAFWLDLADKIIKFLALLVGAAWTWMNYRRSRTYAQKLELQVDGNIVFKEQLYLQVFVGLKNLGAAKHLLESEGTACIAIAIMKDLSEQPVHFFSLFELQEWIEPGESISDWKQCSIELPRDEIVWLRLELRVISKKAEWNSSRLIEVK